MSTAGLSAARLAVFEINSAYNTLCPMPPPKLTPPLYLPECPVFVVELAVVASAGLSTVGPSAARLAVSSAQVVDRCAEHSEVVAINREKNHKFIGMFWNSNTTDSFYKEKI